MIKNWDFPIPTEVASGFGIFKQNRDNPNEIWMVGNVLPKLPLVAVIRSVDNTIIPTESLIVSLIVIRSDYDPQRS